jgi:hypothetical protein
MVFMRKKTPEELAAEEAERAEAEARYQEVVAPARDGNWSPDRSSPVGGRRSGTTCSSGAAAAPPRRRPPRDHVGA